MGSDKLRIGAQCGDGGVVCLGEVAVTNAYDGEILRDSSPGSCDWPQCADKNVRALGDQGGRRGRTFEHAQQVFVDGAGRSRLALAELRWTHSRGPITPPSAPTLL